MMMALGTFLFALPTLAYQELQHRADYRHVRSGRIGARDATQWVGPGDETISLTGSAMAELQDGAASLDELRGMAGTGDTWSLVDGTGKSFGAFVITGIDTRQTDFFADGTPRRIDFGVDLLRVDQAATTVADRGELLSFF